MCCRFKNGRPVASDRRVKLSAHMNDELTSLEIVNSTPSDSGAYKMVATNPLGQVESSCQVTVHSKCDAKQISVKYKTIHLECIFRRR